MKNKAKIICIVGCVLTTLLAGCNEVSTNITIEDKILSETAVNREGYFMVTFSHPVMNQGYITVNGSSYGLLCKFVGKTVRINASYKKVEKDGSAYLLYEVQSVSEVQ